MPVTLTAAEVESVWSELKASVVGEHEGGKGEQCECCLFEAMIANDRNLAWAMTDPVVTIMMSALPQPAVVWLNANPDALSQFTRAVDQLVLLGIKIGRKQGMAEMFADMKAQGGV